VKSLLVSVAIIAAQVIMSARQGTWCQHNHSKVVYICTDLARDDMRTESRLHVDQKKKQTNVYEHTVVVSLRLHTYKIPTPTKPTCRRTSLQTLQPRQTLQPTNLLDCLTYLATPINPICVQHHNLIYQTLLCNAIAFAICRILCAANEFAILKIECFQSLLKKERALLRDCTTIIIKERKFASKMMMIIIFNITSGEIL